MISLGRFAEADAILEKGLAAFPRRLRLLELYAFSAHNSGRYPEAIERWENARRAHPDYAMAWCGLAANLRELGRQEQAKPIILDALQRFPNDLIALSEGGRVLDRCEAFAEALECWKRLVARPDVHIEWRCAYIRDLVRLERFKEAKEELESAINRLPGDLDLPVLKSLLAKVWLEQVRHLILQGHVDEAEAEFKLAKRSEPEARDLLYTEGLIAMSRHDWESALEIWSAYNAKYPDDDRIEDLFSRTLLIVRLARAAEEPNVIGPAIPAEVHIFQDEEVRELMFNFESIGCDCEFGLTQRSYGAEPLGLLRWNNTPTKALMSALAAGFEGMGDPEFTELCTGPSNEHFILDTRWSLAMHTFLRTNEISATVLYPKMCRRVAFLREKFLEDLRSARKILVHRSNDITLVELDALHESLKSYGPLKLLNVRLSKADSEHPLRGAPGSVMTVKPNLFVGFIGRSGLGADGLWNIAYDDWISVCRGVLDLSHTDKAKEVQAVSFA